MNGYALSEAAERAGIGVERLSLLVELGIIRPGDDGRFAPGDVRRAELIDNLATAGIPLDGLSPAIRSGQFSLAFLDAPSYERSTPNWSASRLADEAVMSRR